MEQLERLSIGVYKTLKRLLETQREYGTDDYNEYVHDVIEPLILLGSLPIEWEYVYGKYEKEMQDDFDYGELGDWFLREVNIK